MENFTTEGWTATVSAKKYQIIFIHHQKHCLMIHYNNDNDELKLFCYKHVHFYKWYYKVYGELAQME